MKHPKNEIFAERQLGLAHGRQLNLGCCGQLMAIVNVTPDSFSDGGQFGDLDDAFQFALKAMEEGAHILDVGGESTRPGAKPVSPAEEQARVLPVIRRLSAETDAVISIDTYRAETARLAIEAGAHIINDVSGGMADSQMFSVAAEAKAGYCLMHTSRERSVLAAPLEDQLMFLRQQVAEAKRQGIGDHNLLLDPGFGFGKDTGENLDIMAGLRTLQNLGIPLLIGTSRKRFVAALSGGTDNLSRDFGTAATTVLTRLAGGSIFRVHNVAANKAALAFADAMISRGFGEST